jgi:hypothetical protein
MLPKLSESNPQSILKNSDCIVKWVAGRGSSGLPCHVRRDFRCPSSKDPGSNIPSHCFQPLRWAVRVHSRPTSRMAAIATPPKLRLYHARATIFTNLEVCKKPAFSAVSLYARKSTHDRWGTYLIANMFCSRFYVDLVLTKLAQR